MSTWISGGLTGLLAVVTLLPLLPAKAWWVRGWDFPRLPVAVLAGALMLVQLLVPGWGGAGLAVLTGAIFAYQAWWVLPYTRLGRREVRQADAHAGDTAQRTRVRVMVANVLQSNRRAADLVALVREVEPDLILLGETDAWWLEQLAALEAAYPHVVACPRDNLYGMALFSRWPLQDTRVQYLVEPDKPSIHTLIVMPEGCRVRFVGVHPAPPSPSENESSAERDAELLLVGRSVARDGRPVIVAGDLNDVAWSHTTRRFRRLSGLLDPRRGRGLFATFHASAPWILRWPMDHLFHSVHFQLGHMRVLPSFGSDHFPILGELWLGEAEHVEDAPDAPDADDHAEARRDMSDQGVNRGDVHVPRRPHSRPAPRQNR